MSGAIESASSNSRLSRIAPWQAGKLFAVIYFFFGLLVVIPLILLAAQVSLPLGPDAKLEPGLLILLPFLYALTGVTFVPLDCWLYNLSARLVGGLEVAVTDSAGA